MARRTKLTPEIQTAVIDALSAGNYLETAAQYAGIHPATLFRWLDRGRAALESEDDNHPDKTYGEFCEAVEKARAQSEVRAVALIRKAAMDGTWQAAAWFLERSHPHKWGRQGRVEVTGKGGGPVEVDVSALEAKVAAILEGNATESDE
jgi:transposase